MSSISFSRSVKYGMDVLRDTGKFLLAKAGWERFPIFDKENHKGLLLGARDLHRIKNNIDGA
jgi:hypothetical protein